MGPLIVIKCRDRETSQNNTVVAKMRSDDDFNGILLFEKEKKWLQDMLKKEKNSAY